MRLTIPKNSWCSNTRERSKMWKINGAMKSKKCKFIPINGRINSSQKVIAGKCLMKTWESLVDELMILSLKFNRKKMTLRVWKKTSSSRPRSSPDYNHARMESNTRSKMKCASKSTKRNVTLENSRSTFRIKNTNSLWKSNSWEPRIKTIWKWFRRRFRLRWARRKISSTLCMKKSSWKIYKLLNLRKCSKNKEESFYWLNDA